MESGQVNEINNLIDCYQNKINYYQNKIDNINKIKETDDIVFEMNKKQSLEEFNKRIVHYKKEIMKITKDKHFYTIVYNVNSRRPEAYDVIPYILNEIKEQRKRKYDKLIIKSNEDLKNAILRIAKYQFWARCEYEVIINEWPYQESDPMKNSCKIDVYEQIKMNIDVIVDIFKTLIKYDNRND